jgi:hypothetical protein
MNNKLGNNTINSMKRTFNYLYERELDEDYQRIMPEHVDFRNTIIQNKSKIFEYGDFTCINEFYTKYKIQYPPAENYGLGGPTLETQFGKLISPIQSWINNLHKDRLEYNEKKAIIDEIKKYGVRINETYGQVINGQYVKKDDLKKVKIEDLKKELEHCKNSAKDAEKILNNKDLITQLVNSRVSQLMMGNNKKLQHIVHEPIYRNISNRYSIAIIEPEVEKLAMEKYIDMEAKRRIHEQQKIQKEQKFEDAVKKRMLELGLSNPV